MQGCKLHKNFLHDFWNLSPSKGLLCITHK